MLPQSKANPGAPQQFSAIIYKLGINPCVDVPKSISQAFGKRGYIPVKGSLNGHSIRATLVPRGEGQHRLFINTEMRKQASVDVGDRVQLVLQIDADPRVVAMPDDFARALQKNSQAKEAFERIPPSQQKEMLTYLYLIKNPETLRRNIDKVIARLLKHDD